MIRIITTGRDLTRDLTESLAELARRRTHAELDALLDVRGIDTPVPYALTETDTEKEENNGRL